MKKFIGIFVSKVLQGTCKSCGNKKTLALCARDFSCSRGLLGIMPIIPQDYFNIDGKQKAHSALRQGF
jgi:hypothetical protein